MLTITTRQRGLPPDAYLAYEVPGRTLTPKSGLCRVRHNDRWCRCLSSSTPSVRSWQTSRRIRPTCPNRHHYDLYTRTSIGRLPISTPRKHSACLSSPINPSPPLSIQRSDFRPRGGGAQPGSSRDYPTQRRAIQAGILARWLAV